LTNGQALYAQTSILEKIMGYPKQRSPKKSVFVEKHDEIRKLVDGEGEA